MGAQADFAAGTNLTPMELSEAARLTVAWDHKSLTRRAMVCGRKMIATWNGEVWVFRDDTGPERMVERGGDRL